jgi:hypothetical protein
MGAGGRVGGGLAPGSPRTRSRRPFIGPVAPFGLFSALFPGPGARNIPDGHLSDFLKILRRRSSESRPYLYAPPPVPPRKGGRLSAVAHAERLVGRTKVLLYGRLREKQTPRDLGVGRAFGEEL